MDKKKRIVIPIDFPDETIADLLTQEAASLGMSRASYLRWLIITSPNRPRPNPPASDKPAKQRGAR
jgi:hypothetical protein